jgi:glycosyltransferase involved in cell wall biosynthesis
MKILFIGAKGVSAVAGGVEAHVDELSRGLVRAGHEASVYVRAWNTPRHVSEREGVRLIHLPTIRTKHLDATVHSLLASFHALFVRADIIHYHAVGPAAFSLVPRLFGRRLVVTVHRLDWEAAKWKAPARAMLKAAAWAAVRIPRRVIAVSQSVADALRSRHGVEAVVIPNGLVPIHPRPLRRMAARFGLEPGRYVLFLGRLVPEKSPDWLVRAFVESRPGTEGFRLVLAGGASGTEDYVRELKRKAGGHARIVFTGPVAGEDKDELFANARAFVLPSRLEGHPIALLEARGAGLACLASDIPAHREIIRDGRDGLLFRSDDFEDFARRLAELLTDAALAERLGRRAQEDDRGGLDWDGVTARTIEVYRAALAGPPPQRSRRGGAR